MINSKTPVPIPVYGNLERPEILSGIFPELDIMVDSILQIFQEFKYLELENCSFVSKKWYRLANDPFLTKRIIFQELTFSPKHWNDYCGSNIVSKEEAEKAFKMLPINIKKIIKSPCPVFPRKRIIDTHMLVWIPKTIEGEEFNFNSFNGIKEKAKLFGSDAYGDIANTIIKKNTFLPIESGFVLMAIDVIPGSLKKSYKEQKKMIKCINNDFQTHYEVPKLTEAVVCIFAKYLSTGNKQFGTVLSTIYTRCQEKYSNFQVVIGGFSISVDSRHHRDDIGVAALWRL